MGGRGRTRVTEQEAGRAGPRRCLMRDAPKRGLARKGFFWNEGQGERQTLCVLRSRGGLAETGYSLGELELQASAVDCDGTASRGGWDSFRERHRIARGLSQGAASGRRCDSGSWRARLLCSVELWAATSGSSRDLRIVSCGGLEMHVAMVAKQRPGPVVFTMGVRVLV